MIVVFWLIISSSFLQVNALSQLGWKSSLYLKESSNLGSLRFDIDSSGT
jgi:hypothetical protein|tara:strand:+ start:686 stop:832 length:147 start_codon:yes stop_codon:yes gene_type:complete